MKMKQIYYVMLMSLYSGQLFCAFVQPALEAIDISPITSLKNNLNMYIEHDKHMKELQGVLTTQEKQITKYNDYIEKYNNLTSEQQAALSNASFQDVIKVSEPELDRLAELSNVLMQSKNIDPSWQIKQYGIALGCLSFVKNLVLPTSWTSCFYAGGGALASVAALKCLPKSSMTVNINVPAGVENIKISDDTQQKLVTTVAACALGAGTVIAISQLYTSWMHDKNSRDLLTDKIKTIKLQNSSIGQTFNTLGLHNAIVRQGNTLQNLGMSVNQLHETNATDREVHTERHNQTQSSMKDIQLGLTAIKNDVAKVTESVQRIDTKLDDLVVALSISQQEAKLLKECLQNFKGDSQQAIQLLQKKFNRDFDRIETMIIGSAVLQMTIHQENKENFQAMHVNMELLQQQKKIKPIVFSSRSVGQFSQQFPHVNLSMILNNQAHLIANVSGQKASKDGSTMEELD